MDRIIHFFHLELELHQKISRKFSGIIHNAKQSPCLHVADSLFKRHIYILLLRNAVARVPRTAQLDSQIL
jgi:hypothetical protein